MADDLQGWVQLLNVPSTILPFVFVGVAVAYFFAPRMEFGKLVLLGGIVGLFIGIVQTTQGWLYEKNGLYTAIAEGALLILLKLASPKIKRLFRRR